MQVALISYTPDAELTIAATARASSSTTSVKEFLAQLTPKQVSNLLKQLISFERIKEEVQRLAPLIGAELNPKCYRLGYCDEVESCGLFPLKIKEVSGEVKSSKPVVQTKSAN